MPRYTSSSDVVHLFLSSFLIFQANIHLKPLSSFWGILYKDHQALKQVKLYVFVEKGKAIMDKEVIC